MDLAIAYLKKHANEDKLDVPSFEKACGVGVVISDEAINEFVKACIEKNAAELNSKRYLINMHIYKSKLRRGNPFADGGKLNK